MASAPKKAKRKKAQFIYPNEPVKTHKTKPHRWVSEGKFIDTFAASCDGYHNGPKCENCGFEFCRHCNPDAWETPCGSQPIAADDSKLDRGMVALSEATRRSLGRVK